MDWRKGGRGDRRKGRGRGPEHQKRAQMGTLVVFSGLEENHLNTKNASHRTRFLCSVGVSREGGVREWLGREGRAH